MRRVLLMALVVLAACGGSGKAAAPTTRPTTTTTTTAAPTTTRPPASAKCVASFRSGHQGGSLWNYVGTVLDCATVKEWTAAANIVKPPIPLAHPVSTIVNLCGGTQEAIRGVELQIPVCAEATRRT